MAPGVSTTVSVVLAFVVISILHVVIGEIIPKSYTLPRAERVALAVSRPVRVFFVVFGPFIRFLDWLAQLLMRLLGIPTTDELESAHSEEELRLLVHRSRGVGLLEAAEEEMIGKVFDFADTEVRQVMVPRPDVVALPIGLGPREAMEQVLRHPYTRYPVYDGDLDDIVGILHVRTLFGASQNGGAASTDLRELIRPAHTVPETKRLADLLGEFRRTKSHMAIVVDEYGSLAGIATLEDLIEEIVGDIADEFDLPRRRSCASVATACGSRARSRSRTSTSASGARCRPTTTTRSAGSCSASSGGRPSRATSSSTTTPGSRSWRSTALASCRSTSRSEAAPRRRPSSTGTTDLRRQTTRGERPAPVHREAATQRAGDLALDDQLVRPGRRRRAEERRAEERTASSLDALAQRGVVGAGAIREPHGQVRRALGQARDLAARGRARPGHDRAARVGLDCAHDHERGPALDAQRSGVDVPEPSCLERLAHAVSARRPARGNRSGCSGSLRRRSSRACR